MKITFHGAAQTVTGSLHIVETARGDIVLMDCGMFQGRRAEARAINNQFPVDPKKVRAIVLSHSHIDHIGNIPAWVAHGLKCPIYGTGATVDLCALMLRDSAHIQETDAMHLNKHLAPGQPPVVPAYTVEDAERAIGMLRGRNYRQEFDVVPGLTALYRDAGHILGSASITLSENVDGRITRLGFTGDIGRPDSAILNDPEPLDAGLDALLSESTYGNKEHPPQEDLPGKLADVLTRTVARGGKVIIPAFAVGRTQHVLYCMSQLQKAGKIPHMPIFVDSPLAIGASEIFKRHPECYDIEATKIFGDDGSLFELDRFKTTRLPDESRKLNDLKGPAVIIAASGMCEAGRVLHHLEHHMGDERNTILIVGFQAENTLGRKIVEKQRLVKVYGQEHVLRAEVAVINGFSAHAGKSELAGFLDHCRPKGPLFLVHGEIGPMTDFQAHLTGERGFKDVRIPKKGESFAV